MVNIRSAFLKNILAFLPGIIILFFSMVALHSSVKVKQETEILKARYKMQMVQKTAQGFPSETPEMKKTSNLFSRIESRENWLYWAIIAIGFSGFILLVLNAHRTRTLEEQNDEKRGTLSLLENRLAAMEASLDGIAIIDPEGNLSYMNTAFLYLHDIEEGKADEYLGESWVSFYKGKPREKIEEKVLPAIEENDAWDGMIAIPHRDKIIQAEMSVTSLADGGLVITAHDISETLEANKEKEQVQEQLYQAQKMEAIGRLAGGVAHDFNNILAAMNGYAEFLVEDLEGDSKQQNFAKNILKAGQQARSLVDQILAFSRRSSNESVLMDLGMPLKESLTMLKASLPKSIEVETDLQIEQAMIDGNSTQISQVLMNLCVNAKDAMDRDKGALKISMRQFEPIEDAPLTWLVSDLPDPSENPPIFIEDVETNHTKLYLSNLSKDHEYVCLSVEDTGTGINRKIMEKLFEPFFTTKPVEKGTGLGLSTVHGVITQHRGALKIDSTIGKGTCFELYFPIAKAQYNVQEVAQTDQNSIEHEATILLVEDQHDVRHMTMTMVERMGYEVYDVENGLEALKVLRENEGTFDLVITDHNMPKMTGLELVYQANMDFPDLPFVLLSGYSEEKLQDLMQEHDAIKTIIRKPVSKEELSQHIAKVLSDAKEKSTKAA